MPRIGDSSAIEHIHRYVQWYNLQKELVVFTKCKVLITLDLGMYTIEHIVALSGFMLPTLKFDAIEGHNFNTQLAPYLTASVVVCWFMNRRTSKGF